MRRILVNLVLVLILSCNVALADILIRTDGRAFAGKVITENDSAVQFEVDTQGRKRTQEFPRDAIRELLVEGLQATTRPVAQPVKLPTEPTAPQVMVAGGPIYYVIPMKGDVGGNVLAHVLEKSLADAVLRKPTVVVLDIDSPGGLISEAEQIVNVLRKYSRDLRIVALADKSLSASAVLTLAVKEIYVRPSGIIGAATSYSSRRGYMPEVLEEKMQSVWRATARSSAESGGHEPLLAEAMIDNDLELHLEVVNGKKVVKLGPGDEVLCRKGKILTLTAGEAVNCGLAAGIVDDIGALGNRLGFEGWNECKGLGVPLAEYWPARREAFDETMKGVYFRIGNRLAEARRHAPSGQLGLMGDDEEIGTPAKTADEWHQRSLHCALAVQKAEQGLREGIALTQEFPEYVTLGKRFTEVLGQFSLVRQSIYDNRDAFVNIAVAPVEVPKPGDLKPLPPAAPVAHNFPFPRLLTERPGGSSYLTELRPITGEWPDGVRARFAQDNNLLPGLVLVGGTAKRVADGLEITLAQRNAGVMTTQHFQVPVTIEAVAKTNDANLRLYFSRGGLIFNSEINMDTLLVSDPAVGREHSLPGKGRVKENEWQTITWEIGVSSARLLVNGEELAKIPGEFSPCVGRVGVGTAWGSKVTLKSLKVTEVPIPFAPAKRDEAVHLSPMAAALRVSNAPGAPTPEQRREIDRILLEMDQKIIKLMQEKPSRLFEGDKAPTDDMVAIEYDRLLAAMQVVEDETADRIDQQVLTPVQRARSAADRAYNRVLMALSSATLSKEQRDRIWSIAVEMAKRDAAAGAHPQRVQELDRRARAEVLTAEQRKAVDELEKARKAREGQNNARNAPTRSNDEANWRFHEKGSRASNPGLIALSLDRYMRLEPSIRYFNEKTWLHHIQRLAEHVYVGDTRAAVVISTSPLRIAAFSDELDCVAMLSFPEHLVEEYGLRPGTRLVTVNTYPDAEAPDLTPGPFKSGRHRNMYPVVADFLTNDKARLDQLKKTIREDEWRRCAVLGQAYAQKSPDRTRDGLPLWSRAPRSKAEPAAPAEPPVVDRGRQPERQPPQVIVRGRSGTFPQPLMSATLAPDVGTITGEWSPAARERFAADGNLLPELLLSGGVATRVEEGLSITDTGHQSGVMTPTRYGAPVTIECQVRTDGKNIRAYFGKGLVIFNWEMRQDELRYADPVTGALERGQGKGQVTPNEWHTISWQIEKNTARIIVDGIERFSSEGDYSTLGSRFGIGAAHGSTLTLRSLKVIGGGELPPEAAAAPARVEPRRPFAPDDLPAGTQKTEQVGTRGGRPYTNIRSPQTPVLGFRYTMGRWGRRECIRRFDPVYERQPGGPETKLVMAKDGFVVGGLVVNGNETGVYAIRVIFMAMKDGKIDPNDSYESPWICTPDVKEETKLAGTGALVVGVFGRQGLNQDAIGLIVADGVPDKANK